MPRVAKNSRGKKRGLPSPGFLDEYQGQTSRGEVLEFPGSQPHNAGAVTLPREWLSPKHRKALGPAWPALVVLRTMANAAGWVNCLQVADLAGPLGCSERQARRHLERLANEGYIEKHRVRKSEGRGTALRVRITHPSAHDQRPQMSASQPTTSGQKCPFDDLYLSSSSSKKNVVRTLTGGTDDPEKASTKKEITSSSPLPAEADSKNSSGLAGDATVQRELFPSPESSCSGSPRSARKSRKRPSTPIPASAVGCRHTPPCKGEPWHLCRVIAEAGGLELLTAPTKARLKQAKELAQAMTQAGISKDQRDGTVQGIVQDMLAGGGSFWNRQKPIGPNDIRERLDLHLSKRRAAAQNGEYGAGEYDFGRPTPKAWEG